MMPAIKKAGYPDTFNIDSITTAGALGILIPPSIALIVYDVTVNQSIGKLFLAGIIPGIVITIMLLILTYILAIFFLVESNLRSNFLKQFIRFD